MLDDATTPSPSSPFKSGISTSTLVLAILLPTVSLGIIIIMLLIILRRTRRQLAESKVFSNGGASNPNTSLSGAALLPTAHGYPTTAHPNHAPMESTSPVM